MRTSQNCDCPACHSLVQYTGEVVPIQITAETELQHDYPQLRFLQRITLIKLPYRQFHPVDYNIRGELNIGRVITGNRKIALHRIAVQVHIAVGGRIRVQGEKLA